MPVSRHRADHSEAPIADHGAGTEASPVPGQDSGHTCVIVRDSLRIDLETAERADLSGS